MSRVFFIILINFTLSGVAQQKTISVNATTDMRKVYFDYAQLKLDIIDQFGNIRNDATILSYELQFLNHGKDTTFVCYNAFLSEPAQYYLNQHKNSVNLEFKKIRFKSEYDTEMQLPNYKTLWMPPKVNSKKNKRNFVN
jgi:hypothetical protein